MADSTSQSYIVKSGDTLGGIAQKYGVKLGDISGYRSGNPDLIYSGEQLTIAPTPTTPTKVNNQDDAAKFINAGQDNDIATAAKADEPPVRNAAADLVDAFKSISGKDSLVPTAALPAAPKFEDTFAQLRTQYGVDALDQTINDLDAQEQELQAQLRISTNAEIGKPVALNVIEGRVSEQERNAMERIDFVQRQKARAVAQKQTANDAIEQIMSYKKLDYDVAKDQYDTEFSQNLQLFSTIQGVAEYASSERRADENAARSNLQIIYNSIQDGGTDISTVDATMKAKITTLELQAGLPQGFYANIAAVKPDAKVLSTTTRTTSGSKYADVLYQNADGSLSTQSVYIGSTGNGGGGSGEPEVSFEEYISAAEQELGMSLDPTSPTYTELKSQWQKDYPSTTGVGFSDTELKKLEQAGLLGASRQEQLNYLYGDGLDGDNPFS